MTDTAITENLDIDLDDSFSNQLRQEALQVLQDEPELSTLLHRTVLAPGVETFEDAVLSTVAYRLLLNDYGCNKAANMNQDALPSHENAACVFSPSSLHNLFHDAVQSDLIEKGWSMSQAIRADAAAVCERDPATDTLLEVVLFSKGYAALVCHRVAYRLWYKRKFTALFLQSQASAVFGVDLHPLSQLGKGIMLDHGTGIVVGETATVGDGCTILHGVTLGGTGKDHGDRHPKVGAHVLIGANTSILGNIHVGHSSKIGAGSVVLRSIPPFATAVGAPAKIIGKAAEIEPGSDIDFALKHISALHKVPSSATISTQPLSEDGMSDSGGGESTSRSASRINSSSSSSSSSTILDGPNPSSAADELCPFREYRDLAKKAPPGTVTICTLYQMLAPLGCSSCETGACLFELDTNNVGHVHFDKHFADKLVEVMSKYCPNIPPDAIRQAVQRAQQNNKHFHLTDGTDPHRCCGENKKEKAVQV